MKRASLPLLLLFIPLFLLLGCAVDPNTGERVKPQPPSPLQAGASARVIMSSSLLAAKVDRDTSETIHRALVDVRKVTLDFLKGPTDPLDPTQPLQEQYGGVLGKYDPQIALIVDSVLQLVIITIQPMIDTKKTELATEYVEHIFNGAITAISLYQMTLPPGG